VNRFLETDRPQQRLHQGTISKIEVGFMAKKNAPRLARNHLGVTDVSSVAATTLALPDAEARPAQLRARHARGLQYP
jgi:hypothetical protein